LSNRTCPQPVDLAPVMQAIDEIKHTQSTIRAGLTETRQWLADLGRVVQRGGKS
jgi:capsid protein